MKASQTFFLASVIIGIRIFQPVILTRKPCSMLTPTPLDPISIHPTATLREAMVVLNTGALRIVVALDEQRRLVGVLTDGDIRRALLNGAELESPIEPILNKHPFVCLLNDDRNMARQTALRYGVQHIPIVNTHGQLIDIELLQPQPSQPHYSNRVVLMVGGRGERLRPLTDRTPKPMLPVGGRPILETIVLDFKRHGFTNFVFSTNYKSDQIESHFKDGQAFGVHIEYVYETERKGTAGSLGLMKALLQDDFFVMNGDILTRVNYEHFMQYHQTRGVVATMGVRSHAVDIPYGVLKVGDDQQLLGILEKPSLQFSVNAGVYMLHPEALAWVSETGYLDMPTLFSRLIEAQATTHTFPIDQYWLDIGRPDEFQQANHDYSQVFP